MTLLTRFSACLFLMLMLLGCGKKDEASPTNSITLVTMTPAAGAKVSKSSPISATVNYTLADDEASEFGYIVSMQFEMPTGGTFATSSGVMDVIDKKGTLNFNYPLTSIWDRSGFPEVKHPITIYFNLQRMTSTSQSKIIAKTQSLTFTE